ncbi:DapH/DapD/GlmU-related protein [Geomonas ferrireducens]|uniref:DapH/DapD/GlmU-related protein n=1 Tax=Geomonas ferrireducens TaxID=2570227 RepID=UPI0010A88E9F
MNLKRLFHSILSGYDETAFWIAKERCRTTKNTFLKFFYLRRYNKLSLKFCAYVGYNAIFDELPILPHSLFGIFISDSATIGKSCVIFHHVTIGSNTLKDSKRPGAPTIGNNCYIGAGAKIIGNIKIGDNVRIGANCVVTQDIPSNSTVVLPPPRIMAKENTDNSFIRQKRNN